MLHAVAVWAAVMLAFLAFVAVPAIIAFAIMILCARAVIYIEDRWWPPR